MFLRLILLFLLVLFLLGLPSQALPFSVGDRLQITIPEGKEFSGSYEVNQDGNIEIPYLGNFPVIGLEPEETTQKLTQAFVQKGLFRQDFIKVNIQVLAWAPVEVNVQGAVFQTGKATINSHPDTSDSRQNDILPGDSALKRHLSEAIQSVGGVTPYADITQVRLIRNHAEQIFDLTGAFTGKPFRNPPLIEGDTIIVPKIQLFQAHLVRPSSITPPGIKIFISNLTTPANSNSSAGVGAGQSGGISMVYGSRFSQAVIAGNCAGGTRAVNAHRFAIYVHTDPITGKTSTLDRPIEEILRNSNDENNPPMMPDDGVACYDSTVTEVRDAFKTLADILNPITLLFGNGLFNNK
jgi:polysaccharide biosynthesis/export protein